MLFPRPSVPATVALAFVALLPVAGCQSAGDPEREQSGTAAEAVAETSASTAPSPAQPASEELRQLQWFAGEWRCLSKNTPPGGKPYDSTLHATGEFDLNGQWFRWRSQEQPAPEVPDPISFIGMWGYDHHAKKYVTNHYDSTGLRALQGGAGWKGDVFDLTEGTLYLQDRVVPFREIFTRTGPDSFTDDMRFKIGDQWQRIIIADCKRHS